VTVHGISLKFLDFGTIFEFGLLSDLAKSDDRVSRPLTWFAGSNWDLFTPVARSEQNFYERLNSRARLRPLSMRRPTMHSQKISIAGGIKSTAHFALSSL